MHMNLKHYNSVNIVILLIIKVYSVAISTRIKIMVLSALKITQTKQYF